MKSVVFFILLTSSLWSYIDFKGKYGQEQDILIQAHIKKKRSYPWNSFPTYEDQLYPILNQFKRPFSVIDVGCREGFYSLSIAEKYPAVVVLLEGNYFNFPLQVYQTYSILKDNTHLNNLIFLPAKPEVAQIENLAACEHFDVVMVMNPIGSFNKSWREGIAASLKLGFIVLVERPPISQEMNFEDQLIIRKLEDYLEEMGGQPLNKENLTKGKIYLFEFPRRVMTKTTFVIPKTNKRRYEIFSDFETCKLHKSSEDARMKWISDWVPGINLVTFKMLSGVIPSKDEILQEVERLSYISHNDLMINNMILQGKKLELIDWDDTNWASPIKRSNGMYCPIKKYQKIIEIIQEKDLRQIEEKLRSLL